MFLLGFLVAIVLVLGAAVALYYLRFAGAQTFSSALDTCHASGSYVRLAADKSSLTLQAENESEAQKQNDPEPIFLGQKQGGEGARARLIGSGSGAFLTSSTPPPPCANVCS